MAIGTKKHPFVGRRVEIPSYSDMWMRGARFGVIERIIIPSNKYLDPRDVRGSVVARVRLDNPQANNRLRGYVLDDCRIV